MFRSFGIWELVLVLLIVLLVFGATRLPQIGEALGKAIRDFRKGLSGQGNKNQDLRKTSNSNAAKESDNKGK